VTRGPAAGRIAIVEDDAGLLDQLVFALKKEFEVSTARDADAGRALLETDPDLCLFDLRLPPSGRVEEGLELLREARRRDPDATVVVMSGEAEREAALSAVAAGAFDFFRKPVDPAELMLILRRALERRRLLVENRGLREEARAAPRFEGLVGESPAMKTLFRAIERVAPSEASVLLTGESGTGKELVSRAIHEASRRKGGPFVAVNASALPDSLAEAELFGHEKGAFTGAVGSRPGRFELAHGGTLFLDEIGTLSPAVQAKLLRALESREIERVGGRRPIPVDFRLISATNEDLAARVRAGSFREDLLYRVNSVPLEIPPLRDRAGDIARLARHFLERFSARDRRPARRFSDGALARLSAHPWRGNVRELEHAVEMLVLFADSEEISVEDLPGALRAASSAAGAENDSIGSFDEAVKGFEKGLLVRAIAAAGGVKAEAGRRLGLDANQMKYLCRKYGL
jgi:DNA-binding NtrC family response regulator